MSLIDDDDFLDSQREKVEKEVETFTPENWNEENEESIYWAFTLHRRIGQHYDSSTNELQEKKQKAVEKYIDEQNVVEIDGVLVDVESLRIPYKCMYKSCKSTGLYCCRKPLCTSHTDESADIMKDAGKENVEKFDAEARVRRGDTHTDKLNANAVDHGSCVFGNDESDIDPSTGEEYQFIHCGLHEAAYETDKPLHYYHSIGSSLFPMDILIYHDKWFLTAASSQAKEAEVTRWWITSDETICTKHGAENEVNILQHPDFHNLFSEILGEETVESIQSRVYGESGPKEPTRNDGWLHADERELAEVRLECEDCGGDGCQKCDDRGYFRRWNDG